MGVTLCAEGQRVGVQAGDGVDLLGACDTDDDRVHRHTAARAHFGEAPGNGQVELKPLFAYSGCAGHFQQLIEAFEGLLDVGLDGEFDVFVFINFRVVDVDVDDGAVLAEFLHLAGHAVVEADAEGQQEIGLVSRVVGCDGAVHAQPFQRQRMGFRKGTHTH